MARQERRLAAILAADVVGYSRLMEADEAGTLARFKLLRSEHVEPALHRHGGNVVGEAGDSLLVEFGTASAAVACAVEVQGTLAEMNAALPEDRRMRFRMGVNLGEVIADGSTIHGDGVNIAARLEKLAEPGSLVISRAIHEQIKGKVAGTFDDLGEQKLHSIAEPVRAYRLVASETGAPALGAAGAKQGQSPRTENEKASVAILPFANMSGDPEQEFFSDGITEDIITELSRFHELLVTARNSSFVFKGRNVDVKDAAAKLGVHYVVEGSVRKAGNRVRITAQLIEGETTKHVWAERYDRDLADVFEVQDEVARTIATIVAGRVRSAGAERAHRRPTGSLSAYENYLRARAHMRGYQDGPKGEAFLLKAIELDPRFALAHAFLSTVNLTQYFDTNDLRFLEVALAQGRKAIELDREEAWCHLAMGHPMMFANRLDDAGPYLDRAAALNPNDPFIQMVRGMWLNYMGRNEESLREMEAVLRRDPFPLDWYWDVYAVPLIVAGQYEKAIDTIKRCVEVTPWGFCYLAIAHAGLGHSEEARACAAMFCERSAPGEGAVEAFFRSEPFRDPAVLERFRAMMLAAGVPER